jgi:hypothetical protein
VIQPDADPWGFEEEPVETLADVLQPQVPDLLLLVAFLALAFVSFRRKSVPLKYATLVAAVAYMGFTKSSLISITDVFRLVDWDMPVFRSSLVWYLFAGVTVVSTVLWGRVYCGRVCAFGAFTQLMDAVLPATWRSRCRGRSRRASWIVGLLPLFWRITWPLATCSSISDVEPFWMFTLIGTTPMWIGLGVLLIATVFVRNLYCRFLCPWVRRSGSSRTSPCSASRGGASAAPASARRPASGRHPGPDPGHRVRALRRLRAADADEQKCPHWRILDYQAKKKCYR